MTAFPFPVECVGNRDGFRGTLCKHSHQESIAMCGQQCAGASTAYCRYLANLYQTNSGLNLH